jgi:hypothetical protein
MAARHGYLDWMLPVAVAAAVSGGCGDGDPSPSNHGGAAGVPIGGGGGDAGGQQGGDAGAGDVGGAGEAGSNESGNGGQAGGGQAGGGQAGGGQAGGGQAGGGQAGGGRGGGGGVGGGGAGAGAAGIAGSAGRDDGGTAGSSGTGGCATAVCDVLTTCTDTPGGYECGECPPEYSGNGNDGCVPKPCIGAPGVDCPCIRVTPDGNDEEALESNGRLPFENVGVAIDFAAADPHVATNVCVAGGATCPPEPTIPTKFPGPPGTDLRMREGISLFGSYESTGWTQCSSITTELDPATPRGVYFGPEIDEDTGLHDVTIARAAGTVSAGVTIDGARHVDLSRVSTFDGPELVATPGVTLTVDVDVASGAGATLTGLTGPYFATGPPPRSDAKMTIGVRSVGSLVVLEDCSISHYDPPRTVGVLLEDSPDSSIRGGSVSVTLRHLPPDLQPNELAATAISVSGSGPVIIDGTTVGAQNETASPAEVVGIDLADGADASISATHVNVTEAIALRSRYARVRTIDSPITARGQGGVYGARLEASPGSVVGGITASGSFAVGVHVFGDATDTRIGSVGILGNVGVLLGSCAGAAPLIDGPITTAFGSQTSLNAMAVYSAGDCHPRIENTYISLNTSGNTSPEFSAILCTDGSQCVIRNDAISIDYKGSPIGAVTVAGVRCRSASCAEVSSLNVSLTESSPCGRSCYRAGYGLLFGGGTTLISNISLELHCVGSTDCWNVSAPYQFLP